MPLQTVVKLKLIVPILDILYPIICDLSSDDEDTELDDADVQNPSSSALQVARCLYQLAVVLANGSF